VNSQAECLGFIVKYNRAEDVKVATTNSQAQVGVVARRNMTRKRADEFAANQWTREQLELVRAPELSPEEINRAIKYILETRPAERAEEDMGLEAELSTRPSAHIGRKATDIQASDTQHRQGIDERQGHESSIPAHRERLAAVVPPAVPSAPPEAKGGDAPENLGSECDGKALDLHKAGGKDQYQNEIAGSPSVLAGMTKSSTEGQEGSMPSSEESVSSPAEKASEGKMADVQMVANDSDSDLVGLMQSLHLSDDAKPVVQADPLPGDGTVEDEGGVLDLGGGAEQQRSQIAESGEEGLAKASPAFSDENEPHLKEPTAREGHSTVDLAHPQPPAPELKPDPTGMVRSAEAKGLAALEAFPLPVPESGRVSNIPRYKPQAPAPSIVAEGAGGRVRAPGQASRLSNTAKEYVPPHLRAGAKEVSRGTS
jgi:hypothetical protein